MGGRSAASTGHRRCGARGRRPGGAERSPARRASRDAVGPVRGSSWRRRIPHRRRRRAPGRGPPSALAHMVAPVTSADPSPAAAVAPRAVGQVGRRRRGRGDDRMPSGGRRGGRAHARAPGRGRRGVHPEPGAGRHVALQHPAAARARRRRRAAGRCAGPADLRPRGGGRPAAAPPRGTRRHRAARRAHAARRRWRAGRGAAGADDDRRRPRGPGRARRRMVTAAGRAPAPRPHAAGRHGGHGDGARPARRGRHRGPRARPGQAIRAGQPPRRCRRAAAEAHTTATTARTAAAPGPTGRDARRSVPGRPARHTTAPPPGCEGQAPDRQAHFRRSDP